MNAISGALKRLDDAGLPAIDDTWEDSNAWDHWPDFDQHADSDADPD